MIECLLFFVLSVGKERDRVGCGLGGLTWAKLQRTKVVNKVQQKKHTQREGEGDKRPEGISMASEAKVASDDV